MATVLTYVGEEYIVDKLDEATQELADRFGWGTGAGVASKADTDNFTPATEAKVQGVQSKIGAGAGAELQVQGTITANGTKTITNFGLFTVSNKLVVHGDHAGIPVDAGDQIEYTILFDPQ